MANHAAAPLPITPQQRTVLVDWTRTRVMPQRMVLRARIVLASADGVPVRRIASQLRSTEPTVRLWRQRFMEAGLEGLEEAEGRGRPTIYGREDVERVLSTTMSKPPDGSTHWSTRTLAEHLGLSRSTVQRIWKEYRLQPHRSRSFKFSKDPELAEKVTDVVGLYLQPPKNAIVLSVDEKSQIQALDRTQPLLPMRPGQPERRTHDYKRHGTTTLFASLDVATGEVQGNFSPRHGVSDFLDFLKLLNRTYPRRDLHLIVDNYHTHKNVLVKDWLRRHPRFHMHFTPTSSSWLNQVEAWFSLLSRRAIRRGVFQSVGQLIEAIQRFIGVWNNKRHPFVWVKTADEILAKANPKATFGSVH
ncbi:MAG: IS630 family transposase [Mycobacteriales bacterium]